MGAIKIEEKEFAQKTKEGKVLVDCFATWCGPCKMLSPIIEEVANEINDCSFYKLDVDEAENISKQYGIMSIPTLLLFKDGKLVNQTVGFKSKEELISFINEK